MLEAVVKFAATLIFCAAVEFYLPSAAKWRGDPPLHNVAADSAKFDRLYARSAMLRISLAVVTAALIAMVDEASHSVVQVATMGAFMAWAGALLWSVVQSLQTVLRSRLTP